MAESFKPCSIDGCNRNAHRSANGCRGWCNAHYRRWLTYGDPLKGSTFIGEPQRWIDEIALKYEGDDCLIWPYARAGLGYGVIADDDGDRYVHRRICEIVHGKPPSPLHEVAHRCGNGHLGCVNKHHVRWATHSENNGDKLAHGTDNRGEKHPLSKLTSDDVREIRALVDIGELHKDIADRFKISRQSVGVIARKKSWSWLV